MAKLTAEAPKMKILLIVFFMSYGDYTIATPYQGNQCEAERTTYLDVQVPDDVDSVLMKCVTKDEMIWELSQL